MGGIRSGRWDRFSSKDTEEDYRSIDVRKWRRAGVLSPPQEFGCQWTINGDVTGGIKAQSETGRVILMYRHRDRGGEWKSERYPIYMTTTPCHLGGERHWFICPANGCGRRVAKLYGGAIFACRHCRQLAYPAHGILSVRFPLKAGYLYSGKWGKLLS